MIGLTGTLVDRKGSYIMPSKIETDTTKTYTMKLQQGDRVLANGITVISGFSNITQDDISIMIDKDTEVSFSIPIGEAITIYNRCSKSIGYIEGVSLSTVLNTPLQVTSGGLVIYNNQMHFIGGKKHYKWTGTGWAIASDVPNTYLSYAVVYNDEIHAFGSYNSYKYHYKWNGKEWTIGSNIPFLGSVVVYNNEIHTAGGGFGQKLHYKWDGTTWTQLSDLPMPLLRGSMVVYDGCIHIFGGVNPSGTKHYKWDGTEWTSAIDTTLTGYFYDGCSTVFNNCIYYMGGTSKSSTICSYFDGTSWKSGPKMKAAATPGCCVVYNDELHVMYTNNHYKLSAKTNEWDNIQKSKVFQAFKNMRFNGYRSSGIGKMYLPDNTEPILIEF